MTVTTLEAAPVRLAGASAYGRDVVQAIRNGFAAHRVLYGIALLSYGWGIVECYLLGLPVNFSLVSLVSGTTVLFLGVLIGAWLSVDLFRLWRSGYGGHPSLAPPPSPPTHNLSPPPGGHPPPAVLPPGRCLCRSAGTSLSWRWTRRCMAVCCRMTG